MGLRKGAAMGFHEGSGDFTNAYRAYQAAAQEVLSIQRGAARLPGLLGGALILFIRIVFGNGRLCNDWPKFNQCVKWSQGKIVRNCCFCNATCLCNVWIRFN